MSQLRKRKMQMRAATLVRDFYESLLMLSLGLLLQWNQWHIVLKLNSDQLPDGLATQDGSHLNTLNWSTIFFTSGLLLTLVQYRPRWMRRRVRVVRKMFLVLELFVVLFLVDFVLLAMWQPFLSIIDQALDTLAHSKWTWAQLIFHYCPGLCANDAFDFIRFAISLIWFLLAFQAAGKQTTYSPVRDNPSTPTKIAPKWRLAIDFLVLGQLPETLGVQRRRHRRIRC